MAIDLDYYQVLGIDRNADAHTVQRAYRKAALRWHPDRQEAGADKGAAQKEFQKVTRAFVVLNNAESRALFDHRGEDGLQSVGVTDDPDSVFATFFGTKNPFEPFVSKASEVFGATPAALTNEEVEGKTIVQNVACTLEEIYNGAMRKVSVTRQRLTATKQNTEAEEKRYTLTIAPGTQAGHTVTFKGEGDERPDQVRSGDLKLVVEEAKHAVFCRDGDDLHMTAPISLTESLCGCSVKVTTLDGRNLNVPINEIVHSEYVKKVPNEGMTVAADNGKQGGVRQRRRCGDLYIHFKVRFPRELSDEKKAQIQSLLSE